MKRKLDLTQVQDLLLDCMLELPTAQELVDRLYECIKLPILAFTPTYRRIAYRFPEGFHYPDWESIAYQGQAEEGMVLTNYVRHGLQTAIYENVHSQYIDYDTCVNHPQVDGPIFGPDGAHFGYVGILCDGEVPISDLLLVNDLTAKALSRILLEGRRRRLGRVYLRPETKLRERLFEGRPVTDREWTQLRADFAPPYRAAVFHAPQVQITELHYIEGRICSPHPEVLGLCEEGRLTLLLSGSSQEAVLAEMAHLAQAANISCGISDPFSRLELAPVGRTQATLALRMGHPGQLCCFRDHLLDLFYLCAQDCLGPVACVSQQVRRLAQLDGEDGATLTTLWIYYECFGNLSAAARRLGLHKNTVQYRLQRIRELLDCDVDAPDTARQLWLGLDLYRRLIAERGGIGQ